MKIMFIGESWHIYMIHSKGYDSFTSSKYEEGATFLLDCLRKRDITIDYVPAHVVQTQFPKTLEELNKYDAIVISDIGSNTFLLQNETFYNLKIIPNALSLIKEYVAQGGGLLMIGGYLSFMGIEGKANYKNTILSEVLPIQMLDYDDRVETPEGITPNITNSEHTVVKDIDNWPVFLGYNKTVEKENTDVVATIGGDPLLVFGQYLKGKTACFTSDCSPHWGSKQFMAWEHYDEIWVRILTHISR